jgi:quercetin dioxygenase-like cupin family protein
MSIETLHLESEAPRVRAEQIRLVLEALQLPDERLSEENLRRAALAIASRPELFEDLIVDDEQSRWWLLLHRASNFEVKLLTWERDQSSDWHDHGGSSGVFAVTAGELTERFRGADFVSIETRTVGAGKHGTFGPDHVHDVSFESGRPAVSVHAYSPPLTGLTFYDRTDFGFVAREFIPEEDRSLQRTTQPTAE